MENEDVPRPEEDRITQAEKNKRMQEQLKVSLVISPLLRLPLHNTVI